MKKLQAWRNTPLKNADRKSPYVAGANGVKPPLIAAEELVLPKESRVILGQLSSGYCSRLNTLYPDLAPSCLVQPTKLSISLHAPLKPTHLTTFLSGLKLSK